MKWIRGIWRWCWRAGLLLLAAAGVATWVAGYETRGSDDYLGYSSRWGALVSEWFEGMVLLWAVPPMHLDDVDPSTDASTEAATQETAVGQQVSYLGADEGDGPPGFYYEHGENSGESQMVIMIVYGNVWRKAVPGVAVVGVCATAQGDRWHYLMIKAWLLGTLLVLPAALWGVSAGVCAARARRSKERGVCAKCGYDLRASTERCPECGTPASRSSLKDES